MSIKKALKKLKNSPQCKDNICFIAKIPLQKAKYQAIPSSIDPRLRKILHNKNIKNLYTHQAKAFELLRLAKNIVVVTPTASGKSLCYNLPVLNTLCHNQEARALYIFPTKALAQDQMAFLTKWLDELDKDLKAFTYDGDTPREGRRLIRLEANVIITNPDMLHSGILPNHQKWQDFFKNLSYIVIDELHVYRGIFGSHVANVLRRLKRILDFYGSKPQVICTSATIANPGEHATDLTGHQVTVIDESGAPQGPREIFFYNPPFVNKTLGIRKSSGLESRKIAAFLIESGIQTIVFARSRLQTEVLATHLNGYFKSKLKGKNIIRSYRGGYLPQQRREIERSLREGQIMGVVSTNALELGIDIGSIEAVVIDGYPGTIASTWQQIGRAGRKLTPSTAFIVASSNPLDQYIVNNPDFLLNSGNEHALLNPNNLSILMDHIKCAAYELPFNENEIFGETEITPFLKKHNGEEEMIQSDGFWYLKNRNYPAYQVSLRRISPNNFIIVDSKNKNNIIGEVDGLSAPSLIHTGAIYIHEGQQFHIDHLDYSDKRAYGHKVKVDYYTNATPLIELKILETLNENKVSNLCHGQGQVEITSKITSYKKIALSSHEVIGWNSLSLPEEKIATSCYWLGLPLLNNVSSAKGLMEDTFMGLAKLLQNVVPLELMCDVKDIKVYPELYNTDTKTPTIYFYENYSGGLGFSERLFLLQNNLLKKTFNSLQGCNCQSGCPLCIGPPSKTSGDIKKFISGILRDILGKEWNN